MPEQFDAIIIGAGQAGPPLAARLAEAGQRVALIERSHIGGTCVNDGCTPTKALVASARTARTVRKAADYGVTVGGPINVDMKAVKARKDRVVNASVQSLTAWMGGFANIDYIESSAHFVSANAVRVGERELSAPQIFINTGARAKAPDWPG
ncbi:MAG TPA: FAD-dependent oxidoreductase, partial [Devosia sp.]|nr:FAD-dependent oxidoreductase [Devosia sp.]